MPNEPDLDFRLLKPDELELAEALASPGVPDDADAEAFGVPAGGTTSLAGTPWGLFVRGALSGVAWLNAPAGGSAEIVALYLPRGNWKIGLAAWMLEELARIASISCSETVVNLKTGGAALGDALETAGFIGPDPEDEGYPVGKWWIRQL